MCILWRSDSLFQEYGIQKFIKWKAPISVGKTRWLRNGNYLYQHSSFTDSIGQHRGWTNGQGTWKGAFHFMILPFIWQTWEMQMFHQHHFLTTSRNQKLMNPRNVESSKRWETNIVQSTSSLDHLNKSDHFKFTNIESLRLRQVNIFHYHRFLSSEIYHEFSKSRKLHFDKHEEPACFIKSELWQHRKQRNTHA